MSDSNADGFGEFSSFVLKKKKKKPNGKEKEAELKEKLRTRQGKASQMSNWGGWQSSEDMCEEQIACLLLCGSVLGQASHDQASGFSGAPSALSLSLLSSAAASAGMPGTEGTINIIFDFESQR